MDGKRWLKTDALSGCLPSGVRTSDGHFWYSADRDVRPIETTLTVSKDGRHTLAQLEPGDKFRRNHQTMILTDSCIGCMHRIVNLLTGVSRYMHRQTTVTRLHEA